MRQLYIGNKNYSSWSMRPWVLMRQLALPFEEVKLRLPGHVDSHGFAARIAAVSPAGRVPVLVDDGFAVWDSLAIAEYLAERHPEQPLWPREARVRARARSIVAEMHAGFGALRTHFPMNIELSRPDLGARLLAEQPAARADLERIAAAWAAALEGSGGPFLFGEFGIADAFYAPVVMRVRSYALPLPPEAQAYADRLAASPAVAAWVADALAEHDFIDVDEPYRRSRD